MVDRDASRSEISLLHCLQWGQNFANWNANNSTSIRAELLSPNRASNFVSSLPKYRIVLSLRTILYSGRLLTNLEASDKPAHCLIRCWHQSYVLQIVARSQEVLYLKNPYRRSSEKAVCQASPAWPMSDFENFGLPALVLSFSINVPPSRFESFFENTFVSSPTTIPPTESITNLRSEPLLFPDRRFTITMFTSYLHVAVLLALLLTISHSKPVAVPKPAQIPSAKALKAGKGITRTQEGEAIYPNPGVKSAVSKQAGKSSTLKQGTGKNFQDTTVRTHSCLRWHCQWKQHCTKLQCRCHSVAYHGGHRSVCYSCTKCVWHCGHCGWVPGAC